MGRKVLRKQDLTEQVAVVVGTRPGIIKMSPIIRELARRELPHFVLHTGQHYSYEMDRKFFEDLALAEPAHHLPPCREGALHGEQTAHMLAGAERVFMDARPRLVLVCGDANTNLAAAMAARKLQIELGHVESGLRSDDWRMPEEHNRVIMDHISEHLFAPTARAARNLAQDNVKGRVYITGNTVVDALLEHREMAEARSDVLERLGLEPGSYALLTCHREENVDDVDNLRAIVMAIEGMCEMYSRPCVFPVHPRTRKRLAESDLQARLDRVDCLLAIPPVGYLDFVSLLVHAQIVLTDSGGIQEESCVLQVPCVTMRESTERPESIEVGANTVAGLGPDRILSAFGRMVDAPRDWSNPYGDGKAAGRIVDVSEGQEPEAWTGVVRFQPVERTEN